MITYFGKPYDSGTTAPDITDVGRMEKAIYALFWYRDSLGLEEAVTFRRRLAGKNIALEDYAMCTAKTQELAAVYAEIIKKNSEDARI